MFQSAVKCSVMSQPNLLRIETCRNKPQRQKESLLKPLRKMLISAFNSCANVLCLSTDAAVIIVYISCGVSPQIISV